MSTTELALPASIELERVCFVEQHLQLVQQDEPLPGGEPSLRFGWDWRVTGERRFEVVLQVQIGATQSRPEQASVLLTGQFVARGESQSVPVSDFVRAQAPAILLPWARECIASLTGRGFFGSFLLPPLNVLVLMQGVDIEAATGTKQLETDPAAHGWAK